MRKFQNIKALFFLGIFSMLLMHQIVPHWHHQHQTEQIQTGHDHDHMADGHHHHGEPEDKKPSKGLFDWFLDFHTHTNTSTNVLVWEHSSVKKTTDQKQQIKTVRIPEAAQIIWEDILLDKIWYEPPNTLQKDHFPNLSLRGPPALG
ncbi:hypothetical protein [Flagellimonas marinaquae]|uniref:hypothetical protein n=1 Tax=Flagellimonas marinaquae TaxID=254955 RepID=UPI0020762048|nr:hypothetical protein [Allomuricauda aquimarina]USD23824.1 hypothetical protein MJO53_09015 [Allomuricauda aquimarina]